MDDGNHDEIGDDSHYQDVRKKFKKEFIEQWLISMAVDINTREKDEDHSDDRDFILGSTDTDSPSTSRLDFWNIENSGNLIKKNKVSKIQYLNAFRGFFEKKKSDVTNDENSSGSIKISDAVAKNIISLEKICRDFKSKERINLSLKGNNSESYKRRKVESQTHRDQQGKKGSSPQTEVKPLDQFNRGFSEILHSKMHYLNQAEVFPDLVPSKYNKILEVESKKKQSKKEETQIHSTLENKLMKGDGWDTNPKSATTKISVKPSKESKEKINANKHLNQMTYADSYITKLEKIRNYFTTRSTKGEQQRRKSVVKKEPIIRTSKSRIGGTSTATALTKELIEVPYLKEHDRLQWQGRNRELWFRISALYKKFNKYNKPGSFKQKQEMKTSKLINVCFHQVNQPTVYNHIKTNKISLKKSDSVIFHCRNRINSGRIKKNRHSSFLKSDLTKNLKLEDIFASEYNEKCKKVSLTINKSETVSNSSSKDNSWRGALQQIRELMKKSSEDISRIENSKKSETNQRCESTITVNDSSSEWEDISSPSTSMIHPSKISLKVYNHTYKYNIN